MKKFFSNDITRPVKSLEKSGLLMKVKQFSLKHLKRTKSRFLDILFGTLGASLLRTLLSNKSVISKGCIRNN